MDHRGSKQQTLQKPEQGKQRKNITTDETTANREANTTLLKLKGFDERAIHMDRQTIKMGDLTTNTEGTVIESKGQTGVDGEHKVVKAELEKRFLIGTTLKSI
ncbi:hypothetical protein V6N13_071355 [Hibiscus sabdariffa]